jgi:hypothetical protein
MPNISALRKAREIRERWPLAERGNADDRRLLASQARSEALRRLDCFTGPSQRHELRGQEKHPPPAVVTALAEELPRQVRLRRLEELVDPVVDLAEEVGALAGAHVESMLLRDRAMEAEAPRAYRRFTPCCDPCIAAVRVARKEVFGWS